MSEKSSTFVVDFAKQFNSICYLVHKFMILLLGFLGFTPVANRKLCVLLWSNVAA